MKTLTPNVMVEDVQASIDFYTNVLGFDLVMVMPQQGAPVWALMKNGDAAIMFQSRKSFEDEYPHMKDSAKVGGTLSFFIRIPKLDAFYNTVKDKAIIIKTPHMTPYDLKEFALKDCNGYLLVFAEEQ